MVIGAGHNGLVCAIALAAAGVDVVVLEQGPRPGGALASAPLTLPGYVHDLHAGFFPLAAVSPALACLPLAEHGLEWITPPVAMAHPFEDGTALALHHDLGATVAGLERVSPAAGSAWRGMIERLWPHRDRIVRAALGRLPPLGPGLGLAFGLRREALTLGRQLLGSAASMGEQLFGDERASAWLCGSVGHSDLTPGCGGSAAIAFGLAFLGQLVSWPFPRGGAGRLTDALVALLEARGGELRCGARVEAVEVSGRRTRGVRLDSGERLGAGAVVATVGPRPLLAMLPEGALSGRLTRRLGRWRYGVGTFKLDCALSGAVPWSSERAREAAVVHVGGELPELFEAARLARAGRIAPRPMVVVGQHSLHDPTRAPAGAHTLYAYARVPARPGVSDEEMGELLERRIEDFAPGFRALVRARSLRGPRAQELADPALVDGDLSAGSVGLDQQLLFRPAPGMCRYRTPLDGLYVAGASVHPGPGVHGVSGAQAAATLLSERRGVRRGVRVLGRLAKSPGALHFP